MKDFAKYHLRYAVLNERGQIIAVTRAKWIAQCLIDGIKASGLSTSKLSIEKQDESRRTTT